MNSVNLTGRLTKEAMIQKTKSGVSVCKFNIAVDRFVNNEKVANFITIQAFGNSAEYLSNYASVGSMIEISGELETGVYEAQNGEKRYYYQVNAKKLRVLDKFKVSKPENEVEYDGLDF